MFKLNFLSITFILDMQRRKILEDGSNLSILLSIFNIIYIYIYIYIYIREDLKKKLEKVCRESQHLRIHLKSEVYCFPSAPLNFRLNGKRTMRKADNKQNWMEGRICQWVSQIQKNSIYIYIYIYNKKWKRI